MNVAALEADPAALRKNLAIPYVLEKERNWHPVDERDGKLVYHSPFREDAHPSFDVWINDKGEWRWGDFAEGTSGSVIDMLMRLLDLDTGAAIDYARLKYSEQAAEGWEPYVLPTRESVPRLNDDDLDRVTAASLTDALLEVAELGLNDSVVSRWGLRSHKKGGLVIPCWNEHQELVSVKHRHGDVKKNMKGSRLGLYGLWRATGKPVLLCEGESDAWAADSLVGDTYDVIAIPGVGAPKEWPDILSKKVLIAFDGDEAGRLAAQEWTEFLLDQGTLPLYVPIPPTRDVRQLGSGLVRLLDQARPLASPPSHFAIANGGYVRLPKSEKGSAFTITTWTFEPKRFLTSIETGEWILEGVVNDKLDYLRAQDLVSNSAITRWANERRLAWLGQGNDVQTLLQYLTWQANFLPEGHVTSLVGLSHDTFVWPGGRIGPDDIAFVEPANSVSPADKVFITPRPPRRSEVFEALTNAYDTSVTHPLLAWLAASPLRPKFTEFPSVAVTGMAGCGKTTLLSEFTRVFGSGLSYTLSSTTAYGVQSLVGASSGLVVWFDEYRAGARADAKEALDQLLRDAWTGSPSLKGGLHSDKSVLTEIRTYAPILISGEAGFIESSHTDRLIQVEMSRSKMGDLTRLQEADTVGFMHNYLSFLLKGDPFPDRIVPKPSGPDTLHPRQRTAIGVLEFGWNLLANWIWEVQPDYPMPELDLTEVISEASESAEASPLHDVLDWALGQSFPQPTVWEDNNHIFVRTPNLLQEVKRAGVFTLPAFSTRDLARMLKEEYGAEHTRVSVLGKQVWVFRLPNDRFA